MNRRQEMEEQLETNENARYVMCEEDEMFSKEGKASFSSSISPNMARCLKETGSWTISFKYVTPPQAGGWGIKAFKFSYFALDAGSGK